MYLYEKNNNYLDIYNLDFSCEELYDYRREEMKLIPEKEMILRGITGIGSENFEVFKNYQNNFDNEVISYDDVNGEHHTLKPDLLLEKGREKLLDSYYSGLFTNKNVARVKYLDEIKYFLLTQDEYKYYIENKSIDEIIQLPESLYLLSLIEREKFSLIGDSDITKQLSLFHLKEYGKVDIDVIRKIDNIGLAENCYMNALKKADNDKYILKLIKK